ncbi:Hypothetical protein CUL131002_0635c [Corynebacterium ulcerans]|nr:Hypothetical protein CUL131002_0635c [Corynebacterium ulcerans]
MSSQIHNLIVVKEVRHGRRRDRLRHGNRSYAPLIQNLERAVIRSNNPLNRSFNLDCSVVVLNGHGICTRLRVGSAVFSTGIATSAQCKASRRKNRSELSKSGDHKTLILIEMDWQASVSAGLLSLDPSYRDPQEKTRILNAPQPVISPHPHPCRSRASKTKA